MNKLALVWGILAAACTQPAAEPDLLIDGVTVIDGIADAPVPDRAVAIRDGQVVAMDAAGSLAAGSRTVRIDGRGKFLIPGLWDMHVHLMGYNERAFPLFLANGVTTIREMGGNLARVRRLRDATRSGQLGPDLLIAGPILDAPFMVRAVQGSVYAEGREAVADSAAGVTWVDSLSRVPVDQIKVHSMTPRAAYLAIVAHAKQLGIPVGGHVPDSVMPREAIEAGQRTIEHTWRIPLATSSRGDEISRWELAAMQSSFDAAASQRRGQPPFMIRLAADDSGLASFDSARAAEFGAWAGRQEVWFDPTLVVIQAFLGMPGVGDSSELRFVPPSARLEERAGPPNPNPTAAEREALRQRYLTMRRPIEALIRSGAKFVTGTDVPVMPLVPGFALHHELAALVGAGLTPMQAIQAATRNASQAAGRSDQVGTIEVGKRADLVLLDADPLADIANTRRIRAVVTKGRLLERAALDSLLADAEAFARAAGQGQQRP